MSFKPAPPDSAPRLHHIDNEASERIAEELEQFEAGGGVIEEIPNGVSAFSRETGLTPNFQRILTTRGEAAAAATKKAFRDYRPHKLRNRRY